MLVGALAAPGCERAPVVHGDDAPGAAEAPAGALEKEVSMLFFGGGSKSRLPSPEEALPGRSEPLRVPDGHHVHGRSFKPPFPDGSRQLIVGMGCFWGAEKRFWGIEGVYTTAVGYAAGYTPNPTYEEVCSGRTGHNEVVLVVYDPTKVTLERLLQVFWESHDPTQGMRQGNDRGTQYRSGIYLADPAERALAERSRAAYETAIRAAGYGAITTEILPAPTFYYAEGYHQQYLSKNPDGYCGLGGTGVSCPVGIAPEEAPAPSGAGGASGDGK